MGFASLRFRASTATRWKIRLFLFPCNDRRRRTGIIEPLSKLEETSHPSLSRDRLTQLWIAGQIRCFNEKLSPTSPTSISIVV